MPRDDIVLPPRTGRWLEIVGATLAVAWGWVPGMVQALLILMALDFLLGIICAIQRRERAFTLMEWTQRVAVLLMIGAAYQILGRFGQAVPEAVAGGYCVWVGRSILKRAAAIGVPVPKPVRQALGIDSGNTNERSDQV